MQLDTPFQTIAYLCPKGSLCPSCINLNDSRSQRILWLLEELSTPYEMKFYQRDDARQTEAGGCAGATHRVARAILKGRSASDLAKPCSPTISCINIRLVRKRLAIAARYGIPPAPLRTATRSRPRCP
jgi:hypothetical protein